MAQNRGRRPFPSVPLSRSNVDGFVSILKEFANEVAATGVVTVAVRIIRWDNLHDDELSSLDAVQNIPDFGAIQNLEIVVSHPDVTVAGQPRSGMLRLDMGVRDSDAVKPAFMVEWRGSSGLDYAGRIIKRRRKVVGKVLVDASTARRVTIGVPLAAVSIAVVLVVLAVAFPGAGLSTLSVLIGSGALIVFAAVFGIWIAGPRGLFRVVRAGRRPFGEDGQVSVWQDPRFLLPSAVDVAALGVAVAAIFYP